MKIIAYNTIVGSETHLHLITPNLDSGLTLEEIAAKDVPAGVKYVVLDDAEFPDPTFAKAWELTIVSADGVGTGHDVWFLNKYQGDLDAWQSQLPPSREESFDMNDEQYSQAVAQFNAIKKANIDELQKLIANHQAEINK